jgi:hypothetical protein
VFAIALAVAASGCGGRRAAQASAKAAASPAAAKPSSLLPADLAMAFLQEIKSQPSQSLLGGETTIPPCIFSEQGASSGGEYRKVTGRAANLVTSYNFWILFKIEEPGGADLKPETLKASNAWNYSLRTPRTARTAFGTTDHCIIGPTNEPVRKVVEALSALGVAIAPEHAYILR